MENTLSTADRSGCAEFCMSLERVMGIEPTS